MPCRHWIAALAAALCAACFEASEAPAPGDLGDWTRPSASAAPARRATLSAAAKRQLEQELGAWRRTAASGTLLLHPSSGAASARGPGGTSGPALTPGPALETDVEISVTGLLARAVVRQRFANPTDTWAEGIYIFPLPDDAAVDHMRIDTGSRVIEGQIQEKAEARKTYERAKQEGRRASLVEQERPNVFTTSVANIPPGGAVGVEIEYQQSVQLDQGEFSLRFPTVVGPRYIPGQPSSEGADTGTGWARDSDRVPDASRITPPVQPPGSEPINPLSIRVDLAPGFAIDRIESPYHTIRVDEDRGVHRVELDGGPVPADRDFVLRWTPLPGAEPAAVLFGETHGGHHYALLLVTPPHQPLHPPAPPPRELVYVIDTSGSMAGDSLTQAKQALVLALARLQPGDSFNVIEFNSETKALFPGSLAASPSNLERARDFVQRLQSEGGTEILPAIRLALAGQSPHSSRLRQVVFLTDGSVGNESELFEAIQSELGQSRLFAIGIGSAPNSHFMRKAAQLGRGSFTHIGKPEEVAEKMTKLFRKLESVVLADIEIALPSGDSAEQYPRAISDLYLGEPVVVALKLDEPVEWIGVEGRTGDEPWQVTLDHRDVESRPGIHVLWARRKIDALMDARLSDSDERALRDLRDRTVGLALEHHLVSAYTSLVAVDITPERRGYEPLDAHTLATNLPAGWNFDSVFGMATTATPAGLHIALGLLLVAAGSIFGQLRRPA